MPIINYQKGNLRKQSQLNCIGINLTKYVKDLYLENYKILKKIIKEIKISKNICVHR